MSTDREEEEDCDWETDDEGDEAADQLVLVELIGTFTDDLVRDPDLRLKFIGLDTARPMVQLGNQGTDSIGDEFRFSILLSENMYRVCNSAVRRPWLG